MSPRTPLLKPFAYFEAKADPFRSGFLIVGLHVIVDIVMVFVLYRMVLNRIEGLPSGVRAEAMGYFWFVTLVTIVVYAISWLVVAAVIHIALDTAGNGSLWDALGVAGWGYGPELATAPVALGLAWNRIGGVTIDGSDPERLSEEVEALETLAMDPLGVVLLFFITAWSVYVLAQGAAATYDVPVEKAVIPAVVIGTGSVLLALFF